MFLRWIHNFKGLNLGLTFSKMAIISQGYAILINQLQTQKQNTLFETVYCNEITFQLRVFLS